MMPAALVSQDYEVSDPFSDALLHHSGRGESLHVTRLLNDHRHRANEPIDFDGGNAMHVSARRGNMDTVQQLLERGASTNSRDMHGRVPLHNANDEGHSDLVFELIA